MQSEVRQLTAEEFYRNTTGSFSAPMQSGYTSPSGSRWGAEMRPKFGLTDEDASCRARILLKDIPAAQSELAKARLMELVPGDEQTRYTFVDDPDIVS